MSTVMGQEREGGRERHSGKEMGRVTGSREQLPAASVINNAIFTHVTQMAANGRVDGSTVRGGSRRVSFSARNQIMTQNDSV